MAAQHGNDRTPGSSGLLSPNASRESMMFDALWQTESILYQTLPQYLPQVSAGKKKQIIKVTSVIIWKTSKMEQNLSYFSP